MSTAGSKRSCARSSKGRKDCRRSCGRRGSKKRCTSEAKALAFYLARWAEGCPRPLVLFLDEIDALLDATLVSVLRQLREGFAERPAHFPAALALIGLRDVRDYRLEDRPESAHLGTASPFNVKVESLRLPNFEPAEVIELLGQHQAETGQIFEAEARLKVWELTGGQPWLVNARAREAVEVLAPEPSRRIGVEIIESAQQRLILRRETHGVGRGRIDLLVRWPTPAGQQRWAIELKVWRQGQRDPLPESKAQLVAYLDRLSLDEGTLVIFDLRRKEQPGVAEEWVEEVRGQRLRIVVL